MVVKSPSGFSKPLEGLKNFKFSTNFYSSTKNFIYAGIGIVLGELVFNNVISTGVSGVVLTMVAKGLEFYFKKYE